MSAFDVQVGREGWVTIRASAEALAGLAVHIGAWDEDLGAAITEGLAAQPVVPGNPGSPAAKAGRARRVAFAALQERYRDEFEALYARMMELDQGPTRAARRTAAAATPYKASCNAGEVERNNKRNRCRGRAWTILARAHDAEFRLLYAEALAADVGPVAPYARRRHTLA